MTNPIVNNIFSYLSQEDRYNLFILVCEFLGGNYSNKAQALGIKQSTYYQYINKKLEIGDDKTVYMLNLLLNKDQNKFNEFLVPIVKQKQEQLSSMLDLIQQTSSPQPVSAELLITGTVGFTCRPRFLRDLISMIALGEKNFHFPRIELNFDFDNKMVWWGNKNKYGSSLINKGFFTYDYVDECWGNGTVGLEASKLLADVKSIKGHEKITFWADLRTGVFGVKRGDMSSDVDTLTNPLFPLTDMINAPTRMNLNPDDDYSPFVKDEASRYIYGADVHISILEKIATRAIEFNESHVSFTLLPNPSPAIKAIFQKKDEKRESYIKLIPKPSTLKVPSIQIKYLTSLPLFKSVVEGYKGQDIVSLRFSRYNKTPIYLMKKEIKGLGLFVAGVAIAVADPQETSETEK